MAVLIRHRAAPRAIRRGPVVVALVFCTALAALAWMGSDDGLPTRLSADEARAGVLGDPAARRHLARLGFDRVVTTRLDEQTVRVSFFDGRRIVLEGAVSANGAVTGLNRYEDGHARLGS